MAGPRTGSLTVEPAGAEAFGLLRGRFEAALGASPAEVRESRYRVAGRTVHARVVGPALAGALGEALSHLADPSPDRGADLRIDAWDVAATGVACPTPPPAAAPRTIHGSEDGRYVADRDPSLHVVHDRRESRLVGCFASAATLAVWDRARPFNRLLALWCRDGGSQVLHAAMVAREGEGILFGGRGGSGKSTSSLACAEAGWQYLGDDAIALEERPDGGFVGHSLYHSSFLEREHLKRFALAPRAASGRADEPKAVLHVRAVLPRGTESSAPVRAILFPRVVLGERTVASPMSGGAALLALAPSTLTMQVSPRHREMDQMARLVERVPCFRLDLGRDVAAIPAAVEAVLAGL